MTEHERQALRKQLDRLRAELKQAQKDIRRSTWRAGRGTLIFVGGLLASPVSGGLAFGLGFLGFVDLADTFQDVADADRAVLAIKREIDLLQAKLRK